MQDMLKWNEFENGFECSECGGLYGEDELSRVFSYNGIRKENFTSCHCMDCGTLWLGVDMENYDGE